MPNNNRDLVAIVEDDPIARASLATVVDSLGMDCQASASAEEFLEQGLNSSPSCIVLDHCLPGMDGLDLLERFAHRTDAPPVIFVTGYATVPLAVKMMQDGAYNVLEKPCRPQELKDSIRMAVSRHHALQARRKQTQEIRDRLDTLSEIEWQVVQGIAQGIPNAQLAEQLNLGLRTIEKRRQQIFRKLRVDNLPAFIQLLYRAEPERLREFSDEGPFRNDEPLSETSGPE
jgi:two-component system, LuxR family, response regulator FixJ